MFQHGMRKTMTAVLMGLSLTAAPAVAQDDEDDDMGMMQGRGMMGGGMGMMGGRQGGMMGMMHGGGMKGMMHGMRGGCIVMQVGMLDLSDQQRDRVADLMRDAIREKLDLMGARQERMMELREAHSADDTDPEAIGEAYGRLFDVKQKMIVHKLKTRKAVTGVLTEEQRETLEDMSGRGMMQGRMGRGRGAMMGQ